MIARSCSIAVPVFLGKYPCFRGFQPRRLNQARHPISRIARHVELKDTLSSTDRNWRDCCYRGRHSQSCRLRSKEWQARRGHAGEIRRQDKVRGDSYCSGLTRRCLRTRKMGTDQRSVPSILSGCLVADCSRHHCNETEHVMFLRASFTGAGSARALAFGPGNREG